MTLQAKTVLFEEFCEIGFGKKSPGLRRANRRSREKNGERDKGQPCIMETKPRIMEVLPGPRGNASNQDWVKKLVHQ